MLNSIKNKRLKQIINQIKQGEKDGNSKFIKTDS